MADKWNGVAEPDDVTPPASLDYGRSADSWMDSAVDRSDPAWELERAKARDFAAKWLPLVQLSRKQAG